MKITHILFAVDFSSQCRALNSDVEFLAAHFNARVTLLHAYEVPAIWYGSGDIPLISGEDLMAYAQAQHQRLDTYEIKLPEDKVNRVSVDGSPGWHIPNWAETHEVDLIVMGTHGYGPLGRFVLGTVAMKVLHDVPCPVWLRHVPADCEGVRAGRLAHILCSIDLSDQTIPLLRTTRDFAEGFNATVQLVHSLSGERQGLVQKEIALAEIEQLQHKAGTAFPVIIQESSIAEHIAALAASQNADLLIIGRGKSQEALGTIRTHASELIHHAPCAVLSFSA